MADKKGGTCGITPLEVLTFFRLQLPHALLPNQQEFPNLKLASITEILGERVG